MGVADSGQIETGVDKLIALLKTTGKLEISEISKRLSFPSDVVQNWVDFLVEEKIVGVEYNLTKPYVYLIVKAKNEDTVNLDDNFKGYKDDFQESLKRKAVGQEKVEFEWKSHVVSRLDLMKQFFFSEAERRKLKDPERLWEEYRKKVISA
jgi:hypothetical protein